MVAKNNKKCIICGTAYSYCPNCGADRKKPSWYAIFDGENCNAIYEILTGYRDGIFTIAEANEKLKTCDLSKVDDEGFNEGTRKQIKKILAFNGVQADVVDTQVAAVNAVDEVEPQAVENVETIEEKAEQTEEPKIFNNYKNENKYNNNKHFYKNNK